MGVWTANFTIQDSEGHKSVMSVYYPDSEPLANVEASCKEVFDKLDLIILGGVVACNVSKSIDVVGIPSAVGASDVEVGAMFTFVTDTGYYTRMRVPTFDKATHIPSNSDDVTVATTVQDFVDWIVDGALPGQEACDYRGDDIAGLSTAKESHKRQRR